MRLIVLDTNVIVSAGIQPQGAPAKLIMDWVLDGQVQVVTCPMIVNEYRLVVQRTKFFRYDFPPLWLEFLIEESMRLPNPDRWHLPCPDPNNSVFIALAHATGAWLVTGNIKHFPKSALSGVTVLSPVDYLARLA